MQGADFILDSLAQEGIDHLCMVPGGLIDPFLPALGRQTALTPIVAAQEGGAAYMADGYARASGRFGVALCIGGPGLGNAVTAVAAAQTDGSPLRDFAQRWSIPVATTLRAKGAFPEDHPLSLGVFGYAGTHHARLALLDNPPDLLLLLGSGLNERDTMH